MRGTRKSVRELEADAAAAGRPRHAARLPPGEAERMLIRRGLRPRQTTLDLPFPRTVDEDTADRIARHLDSYAFRLFLRGAIRERRGFTPAQATSYLSREQCQAMVESLVELGLAEPITRGRYRLVCPATSFGGTLEWYVARRLAERLGFDVAVGVKFHARGVGGDLDLVAAAEGKLVYVELKSSPPKHLMLNEVDAFFDRVRVLAPDITLFAVDTALRLSDKVVPMLSEALRRRAGERFGEARRVERELWALTPTMFSVNANPNLIANIGRAIGEGLRAGAPKW